MSLSDIGRTPKLPVGEGVDFADFPHEPEPEYDFYQMLNDQWQGIGVEDAEGASVTLHEAVEEYLRFCNGYPLFYGRPADMPGEVAMGFQYLLSQYGKQGENPVDIAHQQIAELSRRQAEAQQQMLMMG